MNLNMHLLKLQNESYKEPASFQGLFNPATNGNDFTNLSVFFLNGTNAQKFIFYLYMSKIISK